MGVRSTNTTQSFGSDFYRSGIEAADPYVPPPPPYVDDVFSIHLYDGSSSTQPINNGIDLSGEGGLVWIKIRDAFDHNLLYDTERNETKQLISNSSNSQTTESRFSSFNSNGFTVTTNDNEINNSTYDYVSWSFRKQPGFFDIVTYTGNATAGRTIAHNLGSVPGSIWVKRLNGTDNWTVYHRGMHGSSPEDYIMYLNTADERSDQDLWADTAPTDSVFSVGDNVKVNGNNTNTYVAYLFAHDDQRFGENGDEAIIKCGSYVGDGDSGNSFGNHQDIGFEPQFLMIKNASRSNDPYTSWHMFDSARVVGYGRGTSFPNGYDNYLLANKNDDEASDGYVNFTPTGFSLTNGGFNINNLDDNYIYVAIRRPNKPKTIGTDVFNARLRTGDGTNRTIQFIGFPPDMILTANRNTASDWKAIFDRTRGNSNWLRTQISAGENNGGAPDEGFQFDNAHSVPGITTPGTSFLRHDDNINRLNSTYVDYFFKRAPGFFDTVAYKGNVVSGRQIPHNLEAEPEMIWVKNRNPSSNGNTGYDWRVYVKNLGNTKYLSLNKIDGENTATQDWNDTSPTSTHFTIGNGVYTNENDSEFVAYLFGSLSGVSKIGTYSGQGTGVNVDVDCGFSSPARFIMIKRTDTNVGGGDNAGGQWAVWDTARGIGTGNDSYLGLNAVASELTGFDDISTLNSGFTVNGEGASTSGYWNVSGASYIYLAIA